MAALAAAEVSTTLALHLLAALVTPQAQSQHKETMVESAE
jgi:hypothetical protein